MSPVPPNRYERKNVTNRLSSSLSQSTPHLAMTKTVSPRDRKISEKIRQPNNGDIENRARRVPGGVTERKKSAAQSARPLRPRSVTSESSAGAVEVKTRPKSRKRLTKKTKFTPGPYSTLPRVRRKSELIDHQTNFKKHQKQHNYSASNNFINIQFYNLLTGLPVAF